MGSEVVEVEVEDGGITLIEGGSLVDDAFGFDAGRPKDDEFADLNDKVVVEA